MFDEKKSLTEWIRLGGSRDIESPLGFSTRSPRLILNPSGADARHLHFIGTFSGINKDRGESDARTGTYTMGIRV